MKEKKYYTVNEIVELYPFKKGQIRAYLQERNKNGLSKAVRKIGKCIFIKADLFDEWIEQHTDERNKGE